MEPLTLDLKPEQITALATLPENSKRQTAYRVAGACPHRWNEEYGPNEERPPQPDSPSIFASLGTVVHNWAYDCGNHCKETKQITDVAYANESATRFAEKVPGALTGDFFDLVESMIHNEPTVPANARLELSLGLNVKGEGVALKARSDGESKASLIFAGTMDRAWYEKDEDELIIRDWKTDHAIPPMGELQRHFQPLSYGALAALDFARAKGHFPGQVTASLYYIRGRAERKVTKTIDELAVWWHSEFLPRLRHVADLATATEFEPTPCPGFEGCQGCPVLMQCPVKEFIMSSAEGDVIKDRKASAQAFLFAKVFTTRLEKALKQDANANGPIDLGNGRTLGFVNTSKSIFTDVPAIFRLVTGAGLNANTVIGEMGMSKATLKKLVKMLEPAERKIVMQAIDQYAEIVPGSRFTTTEEKKEAKKE